MSKFWVGFITFILTTGIIGGGVYYLINHQAQADKNSLNNQISALQDEVTALNKQVGSAKTSSSSTSTTQTTACQSTNLFASLTNGSGTAGTYYYTLSLKNTGSATCTYSGTTTVSLLDKNGNSLGKVTISNPTAITLTANSLIYSSIAFPDPGAAGNCVSGVTTFAVYPPDQTIAVTISGVNTLNNFAGYYCQQFSAGVFSLTQPS